MTQDHSGFVLLEELKLPGCPLCGLFIKDGRSYLDGLLYENVLDIPIRLRLMNSFGFCNRHAWQIPKLPAICAPAVGFAIFASDLLRKFNLVGQAITQEPPKKKPWRFLFHRRNKKLFPQMKAEICPACAHVAEFEKFHIQDLLDSLAEKNFVETYAAADGICLPHFFIIEQKHSNHPNFSILMRLQLAKSRSLQQRLDEFIKKQDRRLQQDITEEEAKAWRVAMEILTGKAGVFNHDARTDSSFEERAIAASTKNIVAHAFDRVSMADLMAQAKTATQVTICQKEPLPGSLLQSLADLTAGEPHPMLEIVAEEIADAAYLRGLHSSGFKLFYGVGLPAQTLIFVDSDRGFVVENAPDAPRFKLLTSKENENLYYSLLWHRFGHAVSVRGAVKETEAEKNLFCLTLEREREVWCRLLGDNPEGLPGVGQTVAVFAWEKWFSRILDVIELEFPPARESPPG